MRKKLAGVFLLLTLIVSLTTPLTLQAEEQELAYVSDTESLLDDAEWAELEEKAQSVSENHSCGIYIVTVYDYSQINEEGAFYAAADIYHSNELGIGEGSDGVLLLLSMEERDYGLYVYGESAQEAFGEYAQTELEDVFLDNFADDDWYGGFLDYITTCDEYLQLAEAGTPVTEPELGPVGAFVTSLIIASVISIIICLLLLLKMRSVKKAAGADRYMTGGIKLSVQNDRYINTTVTRRKIERESSSSSSSSHRSSSGGTGRSGKF